MPLSLEAQHRVVVDALRNLHLFGGLDHLHSISLTVIAGLADGLSRAVTVLTLSSHDHDALMESHVSSPLAGVALLRFAARPGP